MSAKQATKTANVCANIYEGEFSISFECVGVEACRYALCSVMPPDGSETCVCFEPGACRCPPAKLAAVESLKSRVIKELKRIQEEECEEF